MKVLESQSLPHARRPQCVKTAVLDLHLKFGDEEMYHQMIQTVKIWSEKTLEIERNKDGAG